MVVVVTSARFGYCATYHWFTPERADEAAISVDAGGVINVPCPPYTARLIPPGSFEITHEDGRRVEGAFADLPQLNHAAETRCSCLAEVALEGSC